MKIYDVLRNFPHLIKAGLAVLALPRVRLFFYSCISPSKIKAAYALFNKPHARYALIRNKTMGIALIDLSNFNNSADYVATVKK